MFHFLFFLKNATCLSLQEDRRRELFKAQMKKKLGVIVDEALELLDAAADQMGKRCVQTTPFFQENYFTTRKD